MVILAFFLPLIKYGIQIPILILILTWFFYPKVPFKKNGWPLLVFSGLYIFYLIGLRNTEHLELAWPDLIQKFSLVLFPVIFALAKPVSRYFRRLALIGFVAGTVVSLVVSFATASIAYSETHILREFYMSNFSPVFHPSYVAMYINFAIAILLTAVIYFTVNTSKRTVIWIFILLLSLTLVYPTSKMGFISYAFVIAFFLVSWATRRTFLSLNTLLLVLVAGVAALFIRFDPISQIRINSTVEFVEGQQNPVDGNHVGSNAARIYAWQAALSEIIEHPFGVGTGDINVVLVEHFKQEGLDILAAENLNPHNQYLQSALAVGIPAVLWFLFSLLFPLGRIRRTKDWLYAFFLCLFALNLTVESMLEKQGGIIFFAFFNAFLFFTPLPENSTSKSALNPDSTNPKST